MKFLNIFPKHFFYVVIFLLLLYAPVLNAHFQQDEWHNFGFHIYGLASQGFWPYVLYLLRTGMPLAFLYTFFNYYFFGVQNFVPAVAILLLIVANSFLWLHNMKKVTQSTFVAVGSLLFGYCSYLSVQAVSWVLPAISAQGAFLFMNLSLFFLLKYQSFPRKRYYLAMLLSAAGAALIRNNGFAIFLSLPVFSFILSKRYSLDQLKKSALLFVVLISLASLIIFSRAGNSQIGAGRYVSGKSQVLINSVVLPLKSFSQLTLSDPQVMYNLVQNFYIRYYQKQPDALTTQTLFTDVASIILSLAFVCFFLLTFSFKPNNTKMFLFSLCWYVASFAPYVFDRYSTGTGYLESRYYYLGAFGFGLLVCIYLKNLNERFANMLPQKAEKLARLSLLVIPSIWLAANILLVSKELQLRNELTNKRHEALQFIHQELGTELDNSFVLFVRDSNVPNPLIKNFTGTNFQTGLLYPVLVFNYSNGKIPYQVFKDDTFWDMNYQGVHQTNEYSIGLFYEYQELQQYVTEHMVSPENVVAIEFDYQQLQGNQAARGDITDFRFVTYRNITAEVRKQLTDQQNEEKFKNE